MDAQQFVALFRQSPVELSDDLKEHVTFSKVMLGKGQDWRDPSAELRMSVASLLYGTAIRTDLPLLHYMLEQEATYCAECWASTHTLYQLANTIFYLGDLASLPVLWRSKTASFDTFMSIGSPELLGAGVDATMDYLRDADFPERDALVAYLQEELTTKPIAEMVEKRRARLNEVFAAS